MLETPQGGIWESNAIARYLARLSDSGLFGNTPIETVRADSTFVIYNAVPSLRQPCLEGCNENPCSCSARVIMHCVELQLEADRPRPARLAGADRAVDRVLDPRDRRAAAVVGAARPRADAV